MANKSNNSSDKGNFADNSQYTEALKDVKNKNVQNLMNKLSPEDQKKVRSILENPEETKKILSNPKVRELIRKLNING